MLTEDQVKPIAEKIKEDLFKFKSFYASVEAFFKEHHLLKKEPSVIHSIKGRIKDPDHLEEKLIRKSSEKEITVENVYDVITDIAGIRVMHLHQGQFPIIHKCIMDQITNKEWALYEAPKAYTWDPESVKFFQDLGLETKAKESYYTSIHYVIKPRSDSPVTCEIQVRTLFEEAWGEIDHEVNYPSPSNVDTIKRQLKVLARQVGACSQLGNSIYKTIEEIEE